MMTEDLRVPSVRISDHFDAGAWDELVFRMGGGLFNSHAHIMFSAGLTDSQPVFVQVEDGEGRVLGVVGGAMSIPKMWPFSRYCRRVEFPSLPATRDGGAESEALVLGAIERALSRRGVFLLTVASYDSPHSDTVLPRLKYDISARHEFSVDLAKTVEEIWQNLDSARRREVRKAEKLGVETRCVDLKEGLGFVFQFYEESMERRSGSVSLVDKRIDLYLRHFADARIARAFVSYKGETAINALLTGRFQNKSYAMISGSSEDGRKNKGPVHAFWTAIKTYSEEGCTTFNLGGAKAEEEGLFRFKREFGSIVVPEPSGRKRISRLGSVLHGLGASLRR